MNPDDIEDGAEDQARLVLFEMQNSINEERMKRHEDQNESLDEQNVDKHAEEAFQVILLMAQEAQNEKGLSNSRPNSVVEVKKRLEKFQGQLRTLHHNFYYTFFFSLSPLFH